jgi:dTDP-4-amino-4,6-dideoxygalactose transaminase
MRELLVTRGARHGIARGYPITLRALPELQAHLVGDALPISGAQELSARLVTLPTHEFVTDDDVAMLVRCVEAFT